MNDYNPFELEKFRDLIKDGLRNKSIPKASRDEIDFTMALALAAAVKKVFFEKSELTFSSEPVVEKKPIIIFSGKMRVEAMDKFNATALVSVVHYFKDSSALKKNDCIGLVMLYVERAYISELLRLFQYPYIDSDEEEEVLDGVGALSNLIAGNFKNELARLGFIDLEMSHFSSAIKSFVNGVEYCKNQKNSYMINFEIDGIKRMVVELVMDLLPKRMS